MSDWRKKPVVIQATQFGHGWLEIENDRGYCSCEFGINISGFLSHAEHAAHVAQLPAQVAQPHWLVRYEQLERALRLTAPRKGDEMSYGRAEKPCYGFKNWPTNPGLCGRCAWGLEDHKETKMQPHQQRVVAELKDLTEKREKLASFFAGAFNNAIKTVPEDEQARLRRQFDIMVQYEGVLQERIDHF